MEFLILLGLGGAVATWYRVMTAERQRSFRRVAESSGLTEVAEPGATWFSAQLSGVSGKLEVEIQDRRRGKDGLSTSITVVDSRGRIEGLSLRPETLGTELEKNLGAAREIDTGDEPFDAAFFVGGTPANARALLDAETRASLLRLKSWGPVEVVDGKLRAEVPNGLLSDGTQVLPQLLDALLALAGRLNGGAETVARLSHNVREDPVPAVRLQNLLVLLREFWGAVTRETLRAACQDADPGVRTQAAAAVGIDGLPVLLQLAQDRSLTDDMRAEAVATLGRRLSAAQAEAILAEALRARGTKTASACLHVLGGHGSAALGTLQRVLAMESDVLAAAAARALGATGAAEAEAALVAALAIEHFETLRAAAEALGRLGSAGAVLPLKQAAQRFAHDRPFERAARQAVAEIQSRLAGAAPGQLSLATAEAGQVSLADAEAGRLSLPTSDAGQVSLLPASPRSREPGR